MHGTVIKVRKRGVRVQLNPGVESNSNFHVIRASDGSIAGEVNLRKDLRNGIANLNWVGTPPATPVAVGDTIQIKV